MKMNEIDISIYVNTDRRTNDQTSVHSNRSRQYIIFLQIKVKKSALKKFSDSHLFFQAFWYYQTRDTTEICFLNQTISQTVQLTMCGADLLRKPYIKIKNQMIINFIRIDDTQSKSDKKQWGRAQGSLLKERFSQFFLQFAN